MSTLPQMEHALIKGLTGAGNGPLGTAGVGSGNNDGGSTIPLMCPQFTLLPGMCSWCLPAHAPWQGGEA